ncbi:hypothetical protein [Streptomyces sp. NBC_01207]|uniref:hypothetical protein n=1 Tax=Streptomyces sp. NBC_01207 TaxID=2903772 RepID=UPI002E11FCC2|nr:hypothetical protein OG457_00465 [Streptomyces sp. NBC_01207]
MLTYLAEHRTHSTSGHGPAAPIAAEPAYDTLRVLHRLSLIDHTPDTPQQAVHVHQLIQRAAREPLRANTDALTRHAPEALYQPEAHNVLYRTGASLGATGQVTAAATHFRHLADTAHTHAGFCERIRDRRGSAARD